MKHLNTKILLEFIISNTSPNILSKMALSLIIALFAISLNLQSHVAVISSKFIPVYLHPSSHKVALGKKSLILSSSGTSFFKEFSKS